MEPLKLSDVKQELPFRISKGTGLDWNRFIRNNYYEEGVVDYDVYLETKGMNLQRPFVWTISQKQELILSILRDNPIPKICLILEYKNINDNNFSPNKIMVIDGTQRLNAYVEFMDNKYPLESGHFYKDLNEECKRILILFSTPSDQAAIYFDDVISDDAKIAWFSQINFAGTPQDKEHLTKLKA